MDSLRRKPIELGFCLSVGLGSHFFSLGLGYKPFTTSLAPAFLLPYGSCAARSSHTELKIGSEGPPLLIPLVLRRRFSLYWKHSLLHTLHLPPGPNLGPSLADYFFIHLQTQHLLWEAVSEP